MRRRFAALAALASMLAAAPSWANVAEADEDPRARRVALVLRGAELTDRLEAAQSAVVAAQTRQNRADEALGRMRQRMRARAVLAYVRGAEALVPAGGAPGPYLEVAASKERQLTRRYRAASADASAEQERAETARGQLRQAWSELARVRSELDAVILADDMRRAEHQRQEDEARTAAMASTEAWSAEAVRTPSGGGYAPRPLHPGALLSRHREATQRQVELMRRVPFGPLARGAPLPAGLRATGRRLAGEASWYGPGFNGRPTASGAIYDQEAWTVASKELPLGTFLLVGRGDRRVLLLVNDRGPYAGNRVLDLSAAAARALGLRGVGDVVAEVVAPA